MTSRCQTAGESPGRGLIALVEGVRAGLDLDIERDVEPEQKRRQGGYGRGGRMRIERDRAELISGVRLGETIGSPIALAIWNRDWKTWQKARAHEAIDPEADEPNPTRAYRRV